MSESQLPPEALAAISQTNVNLGWPRRGQSPEEVEAHLAYEAQLAETRDQIDSMLGAHPHFDDDCGAYLAAALRLAATLADARSLGTLELVRAFEALAADDPAPKAGEAGEEEDQEDQEVQSVLDADYDFDGVAKEVTDLVAKLRAARQG